MFKKPLGGFKNSAPIRSSVRRKLKQRVVAAFSAPEDGDLLVPEGILTAKFSTHLDLPGVRSLSVASAGLYVSLGRLPVVRW